MWPLTERKEFVKKKGRERAKDRPWPVKGRRCRGLTGLNTKTKKKARLLRLFLKKKEINFFGTNRHKRPPSVWMIIIVEEVQLWALPPCLAASVLSLLILQNQEFRKYSVIKTLNNDIKLGCDLSLPIGNVTLWHTRHLLTPCWSCGV